MFYKSLTLGLLSISLSACYGALPPPDYKTWIKPGADSLQVKKSMLECGFPEIWGLSEPFSKMTPNDTVMADRCMEQAGYKSKYAPVGFHAFCLRTGDDPYLPACAPDAVIRKPSVKKRLNSAYCRVEYKRFYSHKPPECF
ncbi:hypothetical protein [Bartonella sp. DGB2]|uniref:hypothetical protein n=1 Tax=Bartonella sp. DGB2 TaxID=3388426 RepID=UPI00398F9E37